MYVTMYMYSQNLFFQNYDQAFSYFKINIYNYYKNTIHVYWYALVYCCKYNKIILTLDESSCILFYQFYADVCPG